MNSEARRILAAYFADNDNFPSGKSLHAWPAMTTAVRSGNVQTERTLKWFARMWERATAELDTLPSPAGMFRVDDDSVDAASADALVDEGDDEGETGIIDGFQDDCRVVYLNVERLAKLKPEDCRVVFADRQYGQRESSVHGWLEIRGEDGVWRRQPEERYREARGPRAGRLDSLYWTRQVHPSGRRGAMSYNAPAEGRLEARDTLVELRGKIGPARFDALKAAAVDRVSAKAIGERHGQTWKRASALGNALIGEAVAAANDNLLLAETG
jgi:hypothetical protein